VLLRRPVRACKLWGGTDGALILPNGFRDVASARRLAAIMFTDMVGFTASAQTDEAAALKLLHEQERLLRPILVAHRGREVKSTGDGFLVEFDSALEATKCAIAIQRKVHERNARSAASPIELRIGVHLGDVERRKGDIFGDAVNVASRIGPCAVPGGICISGPVFDLVRNKVPNPLEKLESQALKNVKFAIDVYRVTLPWRAEPQSSVGPEPIGLAVLPFANISPDPKDEYFADGLTEELISVLSQLAGLRVIARTSVMAYRSTPKRVSQIGAELRVSSILEGSVRKAGNRLRVTAQLIDVGSEGHVWAKTYDRDLGDVFAVQTELAKLVAEGLKIELRASERKRLEARPTPRPDSYLAYLKGRALMYSESQRALEDARVQFELAISLDPKNASAHSGLTDVTILTGWYFPSVPRAEWRAAARRLAARAIALDPYLGEAHASLGLILWDDFEYPAAEKELELALSLNQSNSLAHRWYAEFLEESGRAEEALRELRLAEAADPLRPLNLFQLALLLTWLERFDEALAKIQKLSELEPASGLVHEARARYFLGRADLPQFLKEIQLLEEQEPLQRRKPVLRARYYALSGKKGEARALLRQEETLPTFAQGPWLIAQTYADLGDLDDCFRWLQRAADLHELPLQGFRLDPCYRHVRNDPRFPALLRTMNLA
jgi:adenylate cyclase